MIDQNATRILGALLYDNFEILDLFGPLEMFGNIMSEIKIEATANKARFELEPLAGL